MRVLSFDVRTGKNIIKRFFRRVNTRRKCRPRMPLTRVLFVSVSCKILITLFYFRRRSRGRRPLRTYTHSALYVVYDFIILPTVTRVPRSVEILSRIVSRFTDKQHDITYYNYYYY